MSKNKVGFYDPQILHNEDEMLEEDMLEETLEVPATEEPLEPATRKGTVVGTILLNVRAEPNRESEVVEFLHKDDVFEILREVPNWVEIKVKGYINGWIMAKYVKEVS